MKVDEPPLLHPLYMSISSHPDFGPQTHARRSTTLSFKRQQHARHLYHIDSIERQDILSIRRYVDQHGREIGVVQSQTANSGPKGSYQCRWIHLQTTYRTLQDFQTFVATIDSVDQDERSLASILLSKVTAELEQVHTNGNFLKPRADRCDGHSGTDPSKWAIFLSTPYLQTGTLSSDSDARLECYRPQTLFEYFYRGQDTTLRDAKQMLRTKLGRSDILRVHSFWALLFSSGMTALDDAQLSCNNWPGTLVTSSPAPVDKMLGPSIQVEDISQVETGGPQIIRLLDPTDRNFFIPLEQCRTWFAMMDKVVGLCGRSFGQRAEIYHLSDEEGNEITAPEWQRFLGSQTDFSFTVRVSVYLHEAPGVPGLPGSDSLRDRNETSVLSRQSGSDDPRSRRSRPRRASKNINEPTVTNMGAREKRHNQCEPGKADQERRDQLEREVADVFRQDQSNPSETAFDDAAMDHSKDHSADHNEQTGIPFLPKGESGKDIVDSPSEMTEPEANEDKHPQQYPEARKKTSTRRNIRGTWAATRPPYPTINPVKTGSVSTRLRESYRGNSWALVPYKRPSGPGARLGTASPGLVGHAKETRQSHRRASSSYYPELLRNRDASALVPGEDGIRSQERDLKTRRRRKDPNYIVRSIPNIVTNVAPSPGKFDHIFYFPRHIVESSGVPVGARDTAERNGTTGNTAEGDKTLGFAAEPQTRPQVEEERRRPAWKSDPNKPDQLQPAPPPVFLWPIGSVKGQKQSKTSATAADKANKCQQSATNRPDSARLGDSDGNESNTGNSPDLRVLNFVLKQIHSDLTQGKRIQAHKPGAFSEKEAPIYKRLLESSKDAVAATVTSFCEASPTVKAEDEIESTHDIFVQVKLCCDILVEPLEFFLPHDYPSVVVKKFWYAVDEWIQGLQRLISANDQPPNATAVSKRHPGPARSPDVFYVVRADLAPRSVQEPDLKYPERDINRCDACRASQPYSQLANILEHLQKEHFLSATESEKGLKEWVRTGDLVDGFQLQCDARKVVGIVLDHCASLRALKNEIVTGTCHNGKFDDSTYRLPNGLVKGFERILMMVSYSGYAVSFALKAYQKTSRGFHSFVAPDHISHIVELGYGAEGAFEEARSNLMLMSRAKEFFTGIQYDTVGPEYFLMLLLGDLQDRATSRHPLNLIGMYREQVNHLHYEVNNRPRRRLLQEMQNLLEEASAVQALMDQAWEVLGDYERMLAPKGFKTTTKTREALYCDFENPLYSKLRQNYYKDNRGPGQAILVFTIVTIVFLPMSFVSGFLGMNTQDIRNLGEGQWIFWATAIPVTVFVVVLAVWIGYWSESLSLQLWDMKEKLLIAFNHADDERQHPAGKWKPGHDDESTAASGSNEPASWTSKLREAVHQHLLPWRDSVRRGEISHKAKDEHNEQV
ncbi:hypothetical protein AYL99_11379 [Fonsecaea erecta]|uniref:Uncharacterized protein n=1 Tax=Fonsecaea erecta TaxID=1367422 RepID=A0A178Z3C4_9EURO|nr:hypothetical protein AYL99_11379 [Fonsecaea erecta]OAP54278.1 hypothetical protein AYL99_11379 [Fonsecaea erecta]